MSEEQALSLARAAHAGQVDKLGQPYIEHPARVAARLPEADEIGRTVAWLHDVVEDTGVTLEQLAADFGPEVAAAVDALTRRPGEGEAYYARVKDNPVALRVKRADIADNLDPDRTARLSPLVRARLAGKYARALELLS
jgi:(p)ppGpp synthase/HD superfamily hydrolase